MHRSIEIILGRLITDQEFRDAFRDRPGATLACVCQLGLALTACEIRALLATDPSLWERVATELDSRLQKVSLRP